MSIKTSTRYAADRKFIDFLIHAALNAPNGGKLDDNEIYISALYEEIKEYGLGDLNTFKQVLYKLHSSQYGLNGKDLGFTLSGSSFHYEDDPDMVEASKIVDAGSSYHLFIID